MGDEDPYPVCKLGPRVVFGCEIDFGRHLACIVGGINIFCEIGAFWHLAGGISAGNKGHLILIGFCNSLDSTSFECLKTGLMQKSN